MVDKFVFIGTKEDVCSEWEGLKDLLYKECKGLGFRQALHKIVKLGHLYPCMAKFAAIGLVLTVSTADCERCFSCLKRLKTPLRNRMGQKVLNCLVNISCEGQSVEQIDFEKSAISFAKGKIRKISA